MGLIGSVLSSITFIPQVVQAWKTKSVGDISLTMMLIAFLSTVVWLIYGIGLLPPVIICNGIICALSLLLICFKFSFAKNRLLLSVIPTTKATNLQLVAFVVGIMASLHVSLCGGLQGALYCSNIHLH